MVIQERLLHANTDHLNLFRLRRYVLYQKHLVCSIPSPQFKKPLTWYWQWLWPEDLLICTWSEKQKYLKYIYFFLFQVCWWCHIQNWTNVSRYVNWAFPAKRDIRSSLGEMLCASQIMWCFVLHRFNKIFFIFWLFVSYDRCQNDKFCLKLILLDAFMGAQFDWLVISSVKQNKKNIGKFL